MNNEWHAKRDSESATHTSASHETPADAAAMNAIACQTTSSTTSGEVGVTPHSATTRSTAKAVTFDSPISPALSRQGAARMLEHCACALPHAQINAFDSTPRGLPVATPDGSVYSELARVHVPTEWIEHTILRHEAENYLSTFTRWAEGVEQLYEATGRFTPRPQSTANKNASTQVSARSHERQQQLDDKMRVIFAAHCDVPPSSAPSSPDSNAYDVHLQAARRRSEQLLLNPHCTGGDCRIFDGESGNTRPMLPPERGCHEIVTTVGYDKGIRPWKRVASTVGTLRSPTAVDGSYYMPHSLPTRCMTAELALSLGDRSVTLATIIRAVIDSGAAWTSIRRDLYEALRSTAGCDVSLHATSLRFHGVTGDSLKVRGWILLTITLGQLELRTKAFVFDDMAVPLLLGTNTLSEHGLVIDAHQDALYQSSGTIVHAVPGSAVPLSHTERPTTTLPTCEVSHDQDTNMLFFATPTATAAVPTQMSRPRRTLVDYAVVRRANDALASFDPTMPAYTAPSPESVCSDAPTQLDIDDLDDYPEGEGGEDEHQSRRQQLIGWSDQDNTPGRGSTSGRGSHIAGRGSQARKEGSRSDDHDSHSKPKVEQHQWTVGDIVETNQLHHKPGRTAVIQNIIDRELVRVEYFDDEDTIATAKPWEQLSTAAETVYVRQIKLSETAAACTVMIDEPQLYTAIPVLRNDHSSRRRVKTKKLSKSTPLLVARDTLIGTGSSQLTLYLSDCAQFKGPNISLVAAADDSFNQIFPELKFADEYLHTSQYQFLTIPVSNDGSSVFLKAGTPWGVTQTWEGVDFDSFDLDHRAETATEAALSEVRDGGIDDNGCALILNVAPGLDNHEKNSPLPADESPADTKETDRDVQSGVVDEAGARAIGAKVDPIDRERWKLPVSDPEQYNQIPFKDGGRARTPEDLVTLGLDLSQSRDLGRLDRRLLEKRDLELLQATCIENELVWARDAKVPRPAHIAGSLVRIPTGNHPPIVQKPYPIPSKYQEAIKQEVYNLLKAKLIEPGYSDWASPVIVIVKKDTATGATGADIRVKMAVDLRKLNAATEVDAGLLGDMSEILEGFHGCPYVSLCDAAGGFYQFRLHPMDKHKTCFTLPFGCGGTSFIWKVAPYGLQRMPATYSRAMLDVIRDMHNVNLGYDQEAIDNPPPGVPDINYGHHGLGSAQAWLDDLTCISGYGSTAGFGVRGHIRLLDLIFKRLIAAGMTLKPSKAHILRERLEVLGFLVTPEGLRPHPDKVKAIKDSMGERLLSQKQVLRWLGMVNFYRRFIQRIGHTAKPLYRLLTKDVPLSWEKLSREEQDKYWTEDCAVAFRKIRDQITEDCLVSHPDLRDPNAHFALMTDASDYAVGGALYQWQRTGKSVNVDEPSPSEETSEWDLAMKWDPSVIELDDNDTFLQQWKKMRAAGYRLVCLGYFSKSLNATQARWAIFDKEAGAVLMGCNHWHRLIAGRPTTVYTDNTVAASILSNFKVPRPAKLQRWGIELQSYLPHLKISYRKGTLNATADMLSRDPSKDQALIPDELFEKVASVEFADQRIQLLEPRFQQVVDEIWQYEAELESDDAAATFIQWVESNISQDQVPALDDGRTLAKFAADNSLELPRSLSQSWADHQASRLCRIPLVSARQFEVTRMDSEILSNAVLGAFSNAYRATEADFANERIEAEREFHHWEQFVATFVQTFGRQPVCYDLYGGGGGSSRGACKAGCEVHSFEIRPKPRRFGYILDSVDPITGQRKYLKLDEPQVDDSGHLAPARMHYHQVDLSQKKVWEEFIDVGYLADAPMPDLIMASPPCKPHTRLRNMGAADVINSSIDSLLDTTVGYLDRYVKARHAKTSTFIPVAVENVPESRLDVASHWHEQELCGTMFGLQVFRHRRFMSNVQFLAVPPCNHTGKVVGSRGMGRSKANDPNMYGAYSSVRPGRGNLASWSEAMGFEAGEMSLTDLIQAIPLPYGRFVAAQLISGYMAHNLHMPRWTARDLRLVPGAREKLEQWATAGIASTVVSQANSMVDYYGHFAPNFAAADNNGEQDLVDRDLRVYHDASAPEGLRRGLCITSNDDRLAAPIIRAICTGRVVEEPGSSAQASYTVQLGNTPFQLRSHPSHNAWVLANEPEVGEEANCILQPVDIEVPYLQSTVPTPLREGRAAKKRALDKIRDTVEQSEASIRATVVALVQVRPTGKDGRLTVHFGKSYSRLHPHCSGSYEVGMDVQNPDLCRGVQSRHVLEFLRNQGLSGRSIGRAVLAYGAPLDDDTAAMAYPIVKGLSLQPVVTSDNLGHGLPCSIPEIGESNLTAVADDATDDVGDHGDTDQPSGSVRRTAHGERLKQYEESQLQPSAFDPEAEPSDISTPGPWTITLPSQKADPQLARIHALLTKSDAERDDLKGSQRAEAITAVARYAIGADGRVHRLTAHGPRISVPAQQRYELLRAYHVLPDYGHRSAEVLHRTLARHYHWEGLNRDCDLFVNACEVCANRRTHGSFPTRFLMREDPLFPFHTICIDYKHAPRKAKSDHRYILVVVCALSRFTMLLPAKTTTAEETFELLATHVFPIFSRPHVIVADNGSEFNNTLTKIMQKYIGFRMVHVLGYSAFANGQAEQGVRRVGDLAVRHTHLYQDWPAAMPMLQGALNAARHTSIGMSPFEAVFGRIPTTIAELEDPALIFAPEYGDEYIDGLRDRLATGWRAIRAASHDVRAAQVARANRHRIPVESTRDVIPGSWVMLKHGSDEQSQLLRKHGYASHRKYRVVEVWPDKNKVELEVPQGESILPLQSLRRVIPVPASWWVSDDSSTLSGRIDGPATTLDVARGDPFKAGGELPADYQDDGDTFYRVDTVIAARPVVQTASSVRRLGQKWEYLVKYVGYPDEQWTTQASLADASADVQAMAQSARERYIHRYGHRDLAGRPLRGVPRDISADRTSLESRVVEGVTDENVDSDDEVAPGYWERVSGRAPRDRSAAIEAQRAMATRAQINYLFEL